MKTIFIVLLYNKKISESTTLQTLLSTNECNLIESGLVIWNNGPNPIFEDVEQSLKEKWHSVELIQTLDNQPLSHIYNQIIECNSAEKYVFLDDDSQLTEQYVATVTSTHAAVAVPAISAQGQFRSPTVSGVFKPSPYLATDKVIAIGSGISVRADIAQQLKSHYGDVFDSRFALYGVDTTLFLRLHHLGLSEQVEMIDGFEHSLSRLESESREMSNFRQVERAYDFGLTVRHYMPSIKAFYILPMQLVKFALGKLSWLQLKSFIMVYINGHHPKCNKH